MSKAIHIGLNNIDHKIKKVYLGNNNISTKIKKGYIGDSTGKARLFFTSEYTWQKYNVNNVYGAVEIDKSGTLAYQSIWLVNLNIEYYYDGGFFVRSCDLVGNEHALSTAPKNTWTMPGVNSGDYQYAYWCTGAGWNGTSMVTYYNKVMTGGVTGQEKGDYQGLVESDNPSAYPENGIHTDGYWYVLVAQ